MHLRRSAVLKYFIASVIGAGLFCEWVVYLIQPLLWVDLNCRQDENCTKILFIADPQIQGELAAPFPLNYLFIYDSDQYLKSTFSVVTNHFKPDVLVYMGDIMDEGSVATQDQYQRYVERIKNIFPRIYTPAAEVWIPGDNDIGGENEPIRKDKIEAFERAFQNPAVVSYRNISFYKVNAITEKFLANDDNSTDLYKIVVSHYPVTLKYNLKNQVIKTINPNIFFCAHSHESKFVRNSKDMPGRKMSNLVPGDELQILANDESQYEIYVPTCSYRMGTSKIGYGAAIFEHKNRTLKYTVFWSPQRFPHLFFYLVVLVVIIVYMLVFCAARLCKPRYGNISPTGKDSVPLLKRIV